jgi:hypothetical protein
MPEAHRRLGIGDPGFPFVVLDHRGEEFPMNNLAAYQQKMLATWQQHTYAEFVLKDADAALATMTDRPYVFIVPSGIERVGRAAVHEFYANKFLPNIPPDFGNHLFVADLRR